MEDLLEFEDLRTICRVCLNRNNILILLNNGLYGSDNTEGTAQGPLIFDVLSDIMSTKIEDNHPKAICPNCLGSLKVAYNLKVQFEKSQQILQKHEQALIEAYMKDEHFEFYESNDAVKSESESKFPGTSEPGVPKENYKDIPSETDVTEFETDTSISAFSEQKNWTGEYTTIHDKEQDLEIPLKIIKLGDIQKNDSQRNDIQVRCVDLNKFVIEKKDVDQDGDHPSSEKSEVGGDAEQKTVVNAEKLECPSCGNHYSKGKFKIHAQHCKNLKISMLTCEKCDKVFKKIKDLNYHNRLKHSSNPPVFPCKICGFVCSTYSAKQIHVRKTHGGEKSFVCETCGRGFFHNAALLRHIGKHTRETQEVCNICGKSFHYKGALFYHMKMHMNERKYSCSLCERKFYTSQALKRHIDAHTGERRFQCKFCEKAFRSTSERQRHQLIHTGEKPYQCDHCDKGFTSKYNLDVHTSTHRGQQPCPICYGKYLNSDVLKLHLKLKHKVVVKLEDDVPS